MIGWFLFNVFDSVTKQEQKHDAAALRPLKKTKCMWVIKNQLTNKFFAEWSEDDQSIITADNKIYASHFTSWEAAAKVTTALTNNWKTIPKDEA